MKMHIQPARPVYPSPVVLVTSWGEAESPNIVTLAECFNVSISDPVIIGIAIRRATHSYGLILCGGQFVVNLPRRGMLEQVDGIGSISGRDCDKFERFGLTALPASVVRPPLIAECPVNLECVVLNEQEVGDHQLFLGKVVAEHVDHDVLDENGRPDPRRLDMIIYAFGQYFTAGERLEEHGFTRA